MFENSPYTYRFLRKICTYRSMDFWVRKTKKWWNFHGTVQCYRLMLRIAVTLRSNFLYLVILSRTALVTQWCYITVLHYMSVPTVTSVFALFQLRLIEALWLFVNLWLQYVQNLISHLRVKNNQNKWTQ